MIILSYQILFSLALCCSFGKIIYEFFSHGFPESEEEKEKEGEEEEEEEEENGI